MKIKKLKQGAAAGTYSAVLTVIVIAAAIVLNLIVAALPSKLTKIDTTKEKVYTFSAETEKFISSLSKDVTVYYVCEEGAEDTYLQKALDKYKEMSSRIKVEQVDPATNPAIIEKYTTDTLSSNSLIVTCGDTSKVVAYEDVYYVFCEALGNERIPLALFDSLNAQYMNAYQVSFEEYYYQMTGTPLEFSVNFAGEGEIASAIDYVTAEDLPKIYVLGAGESVSLNTILTSAFESQNYITEPLALSESNTGLGQSGVAVKDVPSDADAVLMLGVLSDITADELATLQRYVAQGGNLIVATNYTSPKYENLRKLAESYGLDISTSVVQEEDVNCYSGAKFKIKASKGGIFSDFPYDIIVPQAHGIRVAETMPEGMSATELLYTSDKAYAKPLGADTSKLDKAEGDLEGKFALAVAVKCEGAGTLTWFSSDYYLINDIPSYNSEYNNSGIYNSAYVQNIATVCQKVETFSVDATELSDGFLTVTEGSARLWAVITIGIIPLAFIGVGFAVWFRRRSR